MDLDALTKQAVQAARETPGNYGRAYARIRMVFDLVEQEEREGAYPWTRDLRKSLEGSRGLLRLFVEYEGGARVIGMAERLDHLLDLLWRRRRNARHAKRDGEVERHPHGADSLGRYSEAP